MGKTNTTLFLYVVVVVFLCFGAKTLCAEQPAEKSIESDSSMVFYLNFDQGEDVPRDQSQFGTDITLHGHVDSVAYAEGDKASDDLAMEFMASDSVWLEASSSHLDLEVLAVEFKFYVDDSVPANGTQLLLKGSPDDQNKSNYQVEFASNGILRPSIYSEGNELDPCGSYTGDCLELDGSHQARIRSQTWYMVRFGIMGPDSSRSFHSEGYIFSALYNLDADSLEGRKDFEVSSGATPGNSTLKIGGTGAANSFFNGRLDEIRIYNYVPHRMVPDTAGPPPTSIGDQSTLPEKVRLGQNYPNPFNPSTNIRFRLPQSERVTINVYNTLGQKVKTLVNRHITAGSHSVTFDASGLPSGVYIYRLEAGKFSNSNKMLLLK